MKKILLLLATLLTSALCLAQEAQATEDAAAEAPETSEVAEAPAQEPTVQATQPSSAELSKNFVQRGYDTFYYQNKAMTRDEFGLFLQQNCPEAYRSFKIGKNMRKAGVICLSVGAPVFVAGAIILSIGTYNMYVNGESFSNRDLGLFYGGAAIVSVGGTAVAAGIPLMIVGTIKRNNAHEKFNEVCAGQNMTFSLQAGPEGLGLAFNF